MEDYIKRLEQERDDLETKYFSLGIFIDTEIFNSLPDEEKILLGEQYGAMGEYLDILNSRLDLVK